VLLVHLPDGPLDAGKSHGHVVAEPIGSVVRPGGADRFDREVCPLRELRREQPAHERYVGASGMSVGQERMVPKKRAVQSWRAKPRRLWSPLRLPISARSLSVEVEEASELLGRGLTGVAPVGATLLSGKEPYEHIGFAVAGVVAPGSALAPTGSLPFRTGRRTPKDGVAALPLLSRPPSRPGGGRPEHPREQAEEPRGVPRAAAAGHVAVRAHQRRLNDAGNR
jgi:hypothetical protein